MDQTPKTRLAAPVWAWSISLLVAASLMALASSVVYVTSWEADRTSLEEHRALFLTRSLSFASAEKGDYYAQRFLEHIAHSRAGVSEGFVVADGGVDEFGISRGQTYTAHINRDLRHKGLADLRDSPRHKVRADRFSRATSGLEKPAPEGRARAEFVLEKDLVLGATLQAAQVPVVRKEDGKEKVVGSAGISVQERIPNAQVPWMLLLMLISASWTMGSVALYTMRKSAHSTQRRGAVFCVSIVLSTALFFGAIQTHYQEGIAHHASARVADVESVKAAAQHAQIRGEELQNMLAFADVSFTGEPGRLLRQNGELRDALTLVSTHYHQSTTVLLASLLILLGVLASTHRSIARMIEACRAQPHAYLYVMPSMAGMLLLVFIPFATGIGLSVFDNDARRYYYVGMANFLEILSGGEGSQVSFYWTLFSTILWTISNVVLHVGIGLGLALLLKNPLLRFKRVYRVLLVIPWAIPNYITALIWKGMFNKEFGAVNQLIGAAQEMLGMTPTGVDWLGGSFTTAFTANLVTNTWLGFPFMMVVSLGALQSIPGSLYEAADVDGATPWQKFRHITLPLLKPALFPAIILGTIWTFNMFNVIYLVSGGGPNNETEILITDAYRAFAVLNRHGLAAAYSVIIFLILFLYTTMTNRITRATEGAFE